MSHELSWEELADQFDKIKESSQPLRADWRAYIGSEDYGIWLFHQDDYRTDELRAAFGLIAARSIRKLGIPPAPTPPVSQHFPGWQGKTQEEMAWIGRKPADLLNYIQIGPQVIDLDANDPCTRSWLELLRRESSAFRPTRGWFMRRNGRSYPSTNGTIDDVGGASAAYCRRQARDEIGVRLTNGPQPKPTSVAGSDSLAGTPEDRLARFLQEHVGSHYTDICYSAAVHKPDFQRWRRGKLKAESVMSKRIEDVLSGDTPLMKKPRKPRSE